MRTPRSRLSKSFSLKERLTTCAQAIEFNPKHWRGSWHSWTPEKPENLEEIIDAAIESYQAKANAPQHMRKNSSQNTANNSANDAPQNTAENLAKNAIETAMENNPEADRLSTHKTETTRLNTLYKKVILDLGCGKGEYTVALAKLHPETLFVGLDIEEICMIRGAEHALEHNVTNAVFMCADDPDLTTLFAHQELDGILLNFPTPFPKKKRAHLRLTYLDRLLTYREILAPNASIRLRTDSFPLRDFSLTQLELAGYELKWNSDDVRTMYPNEPVSAYESKLISDGIKVYGFEAVPGLLPEVIEQTAPLSLVSYLPENIEDLDHVPYGMQGCVANMCGRRANRRKKGLSEWTRPIV
ncbi:MAG: methyltransferase domain-containing protein [Eggerthellaceae bacterium]|nr:methyltransferase domain-containing protein [Eggerthellaceae bacterium]